MEDVESSNALQVKLRFELKKKFQVMSMLLLVIQSRMFSFSESDLYTVSASGVCDVGLVFESRV